MIHVAHGTSSPPQHPPTTAAQGVEELQVTAAEGDALRTVEGPEEAMQQSSGVVVASTAEPCADGDGRLILGLGAGDFSRFLKEKRWKKMIEVYSCGKHNATISQPKK